MKIWHKNVANQSVVHPPLAAIQLGIESIRSPLTTYGRSCDSLCNMAVNSKVLRDGCSCLPSTPQADFICERSGDLGGHESASYT
ncbi:hypothetical protein TNCV_3488931 [Trichonephila clavipes]|nr:hypothetical protein TNCV_3488931 [Trichonephila clavipes]